MSRAEIIGTGLMVFLWLLSMHLRVNDLEAKVKRLEPGGPR